jgi:hypothetical protein
LALSFPVLTAVPFPLRSLSPILPHLICPSFQAFCRSRAPLLVGQIWGLPSLYLSDLNASLIFCFSGLALHCRGLLEDRRRHSYALIGLCNSATTCGRRGKLVVVSRGKVHSWIRSMNMDHSQNLMQSGKGFAGRTMLSLRISLRSLVISLLPTIVSPQSTVLPPSQRRVFEIHLMSH